MHAPDRGSAEHLDSIDPLAGFRSRFVVADDLIYLDGNSLGRLPIASSERVRAVVDDEWGSGLIRSWAHWVELPEKVGETVAAHLLGAAPGQVVVSDSTSVNLYKLAVAALDARPDRTVIVTDDDNFPTDRYILEGLAAQRGLTLRQIATDPVNGLHLDVVREAVDEDTALISLSHVAYRSGALADMAAINEMAHAVGALTLWDLCHSVGSVPVQLDATGTDLAVGCTYKYVNAGPGAPAFLYVRRDLQASLQQPIWGWFGQRDQFAMGPDYNPVPGMARFLVGTPQVLGAVLVEEGARMLGEAGIDAVRAKGVALTSYLIDLYDAWLAPLGFTLASPRDPERRGSHVSLAHPEAYRICRALIEKAGVIPDFRAPDRVRLGLASLTTSFVDVWEAMDRMRAIVADRSYLDIETTRARVT